MSPATLSASSTALAAWRCSLRFVAPHQKIGQSDLAAMAGIARESVSRIHRESRNDHYASGALRVAHSHLDALIAIRRGLGGV
jgi:hypothetical protein